MADYINRDKVLVELECGIRAGNYEKGYEKYMHINSMDDCFDTVKYFDTADVVEREKIDNAILVMEREQNSEFWSSTFRDGIGYALGILKKNLGESNE